MRLRFAVAITFLVLAFHSLPAFADSMFTLTGNGNTLTFTLPSTTPTGTVSSNYFYFNSVAITVNGVVSTHAVDFFSTVAGGGLAILGQGQGFWGSYGAGMILNQFGTQLFSGRMASPVFAAGTYNLFGSVYDCSYQGNYKLTIANVIQAVPPVAAVTPEPSSIALLGTGLIGVAGIVRRRLYA